MFIKKGENIFLLLQGGIKNNNINVKKELTKFT